MDQPDDMISAAEIARRKMNMVQNAVRSYESNIRPPIPNKEPDPPSATPTATSKVVSNGEPNQPIRVPKMRPPICLVDTEKENDTKVTNNIKSTANGMSAASSEAAVLNTVESANQEPVSDVVMKTLKSCHTILPPCFKYE